MNRAPSTTTPHPAAGRGYTLLELVVVLGVLAILALIVVPTFNRVKENSVARTTQTILEALDRNGEALAISDPALLDSALAEIVAAEIDAPAGVTVTRDGATITVTNTVGTDSATGTVTFIDGVGTIDDAVSAPDTTPVTTLTTTPTTTPAPQLYAIGDTGPGGGIVFHVDVGGFACGAEITSTCTYLEAAPADSETEITWAETENQSVDVDGADATAIGSGHRNSIDIGAQTGNDSATSAAVYALSYVNNGYTDWFLPSKDELDELHLRRGIVGGFTTGSYWSSTEYNAYDAWTRHFGFGYHSYDSKASIDTFRVRPVRAG